jgi:polyhydroxyalkanoate synthesis regulator phasin
MPAPKPTSGGSRATSGRGSSSKSAAGRSGKTSIHGDPTRPGSAASPDSGGEGDALTTFAEQLTNRILRPLGLVVLSRERIQEILDDAALRGRVTRSDANELVAELVDRGRQQTEQLLSDVERLFGRGRAQLDSATARARRSESLDLLLRSADRARRTVGAGDSFPIFGYDDLTSAQVQDRLGGLSPAELRKVRDYERRHANRKSVLAAIDEHLTTI